MALAPVAFPVISLDRTRRKQAPSHKPSHTTSAIAGAIGNAFSRTAIAPLERTRMQMITDPRRHGSMFACLRYVWRSEGVRGLWRGNCINVARIAPQGAISFFAKDYFKQWFQGHNLQ